MIEVKFIVETVEELKKDVAEMVQALGMSPAAEQPKAQPIEVVPYPPQPELIPTQAAAPAPTQTAAAPVPLVQAPAFTQEQISIACVGLIDQNRQAELEQLLAEFGIQAITQLPQEQYGNFATRLRALGAQI